MTLAWKRRLCAFLLGILATLTLPPFFIAPLIIVAYGGLYVLLQTATSARAAFALGWWWGWGFYISGLYWFTIALLTEPDKFAWLIPFALFGLTAVIAIYSGVACMVYRMARGRGVADILLFATIWTLVEYTRGHLFTGFPWNLPGYALAASNSTLQLASLFGAYGVSWIVVLLGALPAALMLKYRYARSSVIIAYLLFAVGCGWGWLGYEVDSDEYVEGVTLRLVQANIVQHHKWDPKLQFDGLRKHIELTLSPGIERVTHVIWPETATPYVLSTDSTLTRRLGDTLSEGQILITGSLRRDGDELWNSITALDHNGTIVGQYDKHRLVPFGEFLPFRALLPASWLTPVGSKDFSAGPGPQTFSWPGLPPVSPLICYEAIFPEIPSAPPPAWLLNLTNDAWFGLSTGPHQHLHMARMRAVEQGVPLIRVANTGITAAIDAHGRVRSRLELGKEGILDIQLTKSQLYSTWYRKYPHLTLIFLLMMALSLTILFRNGQRP